MKTKTERVRIVDEETGEERDARIERNIGRGRKPLGARGFAMVWIDGMIDADLTSRQLAVLLLLAERANDRGIAEYRLDSIAEQARCPKSTAWRALQQMIEDDVVRRIGRGRVQINPNIIWQGDNGVRSVAMVRWHNQLDAKPFTGERKYSA